MCSLISHKKQQGLNKKTRLGQAIKFSPGASQCTGNAEGLTLIISRNNLYGKRGFEWFIRLTASTLFPQNLDMAEVERLSSVEVMLSPCNDLLLCWDRSSWKGSRWWRARQSGSPIVHHDDQGRYCNLLWCHEVGAWLGKGRDFHPHVWIGFAWRCCSAKIRHRACPAAQSGSLLLTRPSEPAQLWGISTHSQPSSKQ